MPRRLLLLLPCLLLLVSCAPRAATFSAPPPASPSPVPGPLSGLTVLVDPGHGGYDGGARCTTSGKWEKELNLRMGKAVQSALKEAGAQVLMTRTSDVDLCEPLDPEKTKKRQDMERRVAMAADGRADMVLSIHMNKYRSARESGPQVFYRQGSDAGRLLAGCMQAQLISALHPPQKREALSGDYFILQLDIPSVLIECGFISNPAEEKLLLTDAYQQQLAQAVVQGAREYLHLQKMATASKST